MRPAARRPGAAANATVKRAPRTAAAQPKPAKDECADVALEPTVIVPEDQVKGLTAKELDEDITRVMTADNPQLLTSTVHYSYVDREYKPVPAAADEHMVLHFSQDGSWAHGASEGAAAQRAYERSYREAVDAKRRERQRALEEGAADLAELCASGGGASGDGGGGDADDELLQRNQFNFCERAAQCFQPPARERGMATVPVETRVACGSMSQWALHDAYAAEVARAAGGGGGGGGGGSERAAAAAAGAGAGTASVTGVLGDGGGGGLAAATAAAAAAAAASISAAAAPNRAGGSSSGAASSSGGRSSGGGVMHSAALAASLVALERLCVQNAEDEVHCDASWWEDASDAFKPGTGTLLPLWKFDDARGNPKRKSVTCLAWCRLYPDLFGVGYGRYEFMAQGSGGVALYSLKNVATPECVYPLDSGAMALAFHPQQPAILAVGCYDGSVRVFDARRPEPRAAFVADTKSGRHSDPVWGVAWLPQRDASCPLAFLSVSSDGRVARWTVTKSELRMEEVMRLRLEAGTGAAAGAGGGDAGAAAAPSSSSSASSFSASAWAGGGSRRGSGGGPATSADAAATTTSALASLPAVTTASSVHVTPAAGSSVTSATAGGGGVGGGAGAPALAGVLGLASGVCFDFSPFDPNLFLVGTEEGRIHLANLEYTAKYKATYSGHTMAVYAVRWNAFHPRMFISASADWSVRLWDTTHGVAVKTFDLGCPVGDVCWAPTSSTSFAAVTDDGKVVVFDLAIDHHGPMCEQKVVKKAKATKLAFNARSPLLLVGDSASGVSSFKLSPNLRRLTAIPSPAFKKGEALPPPPPSREEVEVRKLDAWLGTTDARISLVTPIPGQTQRGDARPGCKAGGGDGRLGAGAEGGGSDEAGADEDAGAGAAV